MPYKLETRNGKHCVVRADDGTVVPGGCHDSAKDAVAHLRALYANVRDARKAAREKSKTR